MHGPVIFIFIYKIKHRSKLLKVNEKEYIRVWCALYRSV